MSTFKGRLKGELFDFIAIDDFTESNYSASAFFLSHMHTDHMAGLLDPIKSNKFGELFKSHNDKRFFCSEITKRLFEMDTAKCSIPKDRIIGLNCGQSIVVSSASKSSEIDVEPPLVTVTLIPTAHILGAVMFLFECKDRSALYTGDFRIQIEDVDKLNSLHNDVGNVKKITDLYLDTTFANELYPRFPTRSAATMEIVRLAKEWLQLSPYNIVAILEVAKYGYERLLIDVSKALNTKILVSEEMHLKYKYIPEMDSAVFSDTNDSEPVLKRQKSNSSYLKGRIHACKTYMSCTLCSSVQRNHLREIKPCAMAFHNVTRLENLCRISNSSNKIRVAYATHSSLEELQYFVKYLSPENIYPSVISKKTESEIIALLQPNKEKPVFKVNQHESVIDGSPVKCDSSSDDDDDDDDDDENSGILMDSPPW